MLYCAYTKKVRHMTTATKMKKPKRAPKRGLTGRKLLIARGVALYGKSVEEMALILGMNTRCVRRSLDWIKEKAGVTKNCELAHWMHSQGMGFCNEDAKQDYLNKNKEWRDAA